MQPKYFVTSTSYVGPNPFDDRNVDADRIEITTICPRTNSSHEFKTEGWCGTTGDWSLSAHGQYDTEAAARAYIAETYGEVRELGSEHPYFYQDDDGVVAVFKLGKYIPMSSSSTADWAFEGMRADITADTTDEKIADLVTDYESAANVDGYTLDGDLQLFMEARRQELRDERDEQQNDQ